MTLCGIRAWLVSHWDTGFHLRQLESFITPMLGPYPRVLGAFCTGLWSEAMQDQVDPRPEVEGTMEDLETQERRWSTSVMLQCSSQPTCSWMWMGSMQNEHAHVLTRLCVSIQLLPALIPRHLSVLAAYCSRNDQGDFIVFPATLKQRHICATLSIGRCGPWLT